MNMEEKIKKLFLQVMEKHDGNKSNAAASLGVNNVTFWSWVNGKRGLNSTLCSAIDRAGGILIIPGDEAYKNYSQDIDIERIIMKNTELQKRVEKLEAQKEALLEALGQPPIKEETSTQEVSGKPQKLSALTGTGEI